MFTLTLFKINNFFDLIHNDLNCIFKFFISPIKIIPKQFFFLIDHTNSLYLLKNILYLKYFSIKYMRNILKLKILLFNIKNLCFKIFKAYGINMRIFRLAKKKRKNLLFFRLGFSHGFIIHLPKIFFFRVFKRRYFLLVGNDHEYLKNLSYQITSLRKFFRYKLIGIKSLRDRFLIRVGKKKSF